MKGRKGKIDDLLETLVDFHDSFLPRSSHPEQDAVQDKVNFILHGFGGVTLKQFLKLGLELVEGGEAGHGLVLADKGGYSLFAFGYFAVDLFDLVLELFLLFLHQLNV